MRTLLLISIYLLHSAAAASSPNKYMVCSWSQARTGTVQDALYVDGGDLERALWNDGEWISNTGITTTGDSGNLWKFSYTKSYDFGSDCAFDWDTFNTSLVEYIPLADEDNYWDGTMFVDEQELYTYGGFVSIQLPDGGDPPDYILEYELFPSPGQASGPWGERLPFSLDHVGINNHITHGAGVSAPSEALAFYFGGMHAASWGPLSPYNPTQAANTLIQADLSSPGGIAAQNNTLPPDVETRASGQLVWIPRSTRGLLLAIGGVPYPPDLFSMNLSSDQASANREQGPRFMTTIPVYDVESGAWYTQDTTGGPPPASMQFCTVVTTADSMSFDIFAYGGYNGMTGAAYDDVWVLSVPAFHWVKVYDGTSTPLHARSGQACSLPYPDQMLVFGGTNLGFGHYGTSCIQDGSIVDVFDLIQLKWTKKYDPSQWSTYARSQVITNAIAGAAGASSAVAGLFSSEYGSSSKLPKWSAYKKTGHAGSCSKSGTPIGAVVGGVVGGVVALAAVALIWWLWTRNKKDRTNTRDRSNSESTTRHSRIAFWRNTVPPALPKDDMTDSTATEVDGPLTPPAQTDQMAELYGASFYAPRPSHQVNEASAENGLQPHTSPALSSTTPRSPRSPPTGAAFVEAEAQDNSIHELHDAPKPSRLSQISSELGSTTNNYRNHPLYPWSVDGVPRRTNSDSTAPNLSQTSRGRHNSGSPPSPVTNPTRPELSSNGDAEGGDTMTSASAQVHTAMAVPIRPIHNRNASSISSELPASPVMRQHGGRQGVDNKALKPVSPLLQQGGEEMQTDGDGRPKHARHGSSMSGFGLPSPAEGVEAGEDGIGSGLGNTAGMRESVKRKPVGGSSAYAEMMQRRAS